MQLHISLPFSRYLTLKNCDLEIQVKTYSSYESVHRLYIAEIDRPRSYLVCRGSSMGLSLPIQEVPENAVYGTNRKPVCNFLLVFRC